MSDHFGAVTAAKHFASAIGSRRVHSRSNNSRSDQCSCTLPPSLHTAAVHSDCQSGISFASRRLPFESASAGCCCCCCLCSCRCVSDRSFSLHHSTVAGRLPIPFARSARRSDVSAALRASHRHSAALCKPVACEGSSGACSAIGVWCGDLMRRCY